MKINLQKRTYLYILIIINLINPYNFCNKGCLSCKTNELNQKQTCSICDSENFYFLNPENECQKKSIQGCSQAIPNTSNTSLKCQKCDSDFILNQTTGECISSSSLPTITPNCQEYDSIENQCKKCTQGWALEEKECVPVQSQISFCLEYSSPTQCARCASGYSITSFFECEKISSIENCMIHSEYICDECVQGFSLLDMRHWSNINQLIRWMRMGQVHGVELIDPEFSGCVEDSVPFCDRVDSNKACLVCKENYYLFENKCIAIPSAKISFCLSYENHRKCEKCMEGYYLSDPVSFYFENSCKKVTFKERCEEYSESKDECIRCHSEYYSNSKGDCVLPRDKSLIIPNCQSLSIDADTCAECASNYIVSADGHFCGKKVDFCLEHIWIDNLQISCAKCDDNFFLSSSAPSTCLKKMDPNCKIFSNSETNCTECKESFQWDANKKKCVSFDIGNCQTYSNNRCETCHSSFYFNSNKNTCIKLNVLNCLEYSSFSGNCSKCTNSYVLDTFRNICIAAPDPNCTTFSNSLTCSTCAQSFYLHEKVEECLPQDVLNCKTYNDHSCSTCDDGFTLSQEFNICIPMIAIHNCLEFDFTQTRCSKCVPLYFVNGNGNCESVSIIDKCSSYSALANACEECESTHYINSSSNTCTIRENNGNCFTYPKDSDSCSACNPGYYFDSNGKCVISDYITDNNCTSNKTTDSNNCSSCKTGFFLTNVESFENNSSEQCLSTNQTTNKCQQCASNFYLNDFDFCEENSSTKSKCIQTTIASIDSLVSNTNCFLCREETQFTLENSSCAARHGSEVFGCDYLKSTEDDLLSSQCICQNNINPIKITSGVNICVPETSSFKSSNDSNCKVFNADKPDQCLICNSGYSLQSGTEDELDWMLCQPIVSSSSTSTDILFQKANAFGLQVNSEIIANPINNCLKHVQVSSSLILCAECVSNATKIYNAQDASTFKYTNWNGSSNEFYSTFLAVSECFVLGQETPDKYTFYVDKNATSSEDPFAEAAVCPLAIISEGTNIRCITCPSNKTAVYGDGYLDVHSSDSKFPIILECKDTAFTKQFQGFGLGISDNSSLSELIKFDSCPNQTEVLDFHGSWSLSNEIEISSEGKLFMEQN